MQYYITKKAVKQSIKNLSSFFKDKGYEIPQNVYLEGFAKALSFKNWNTLEGMVNNGQVIKNTPNKKVYLLEIEVALDKDTVEKELISSFNDGKCNMKISQVISQGNNHHFEITFPESNNNFLTGIVLFAKKMQPYNPTRFEMLRMSVEKESLLEILKI